MLGDLGASTLRSIMTITQFSSLFEHQTSHVVCFNARGLLYVRLRCPLVSFVAPTHWETRFASRRYSTYFLFLFLDHHTDHPACHDARILLYECILDAL
jgi:hypothetical protein